MLIQYLRKEKGAPPYGVVLYEGGHFGYSVCMAVDVWDRKQAMKIARGRARSPRNAKIIMRLENFALAGMPKAMEVMGIIDRMTIYMSAEAPSGR